MRRPPLLGAPHLGLSVTRLPIVLERIVRLPLVLRRYSAKVSALQSSAYAALLVCRFYCEPR